MLSRRTLTLALAGLLAAPLGTPSPAVAAETAKVGVVLPMTGGLAPFGQASLQGLELAAERINEAGGLGGQYPIELVQADATDDPTTAASVTQRLVSRDRVMAIVGAFASSLSLAASEVTERSRTPFLTMSFTDQLTGRGFKHIFQIVPKASVIGAAQIDQTLELGKAAGKPVDRIAILYEDTAYGSSQADGLRARADELGLDVVLFEGYPKGINDVTPLVQKMASSGAQAVFPVSYFTDAVLIIRSMRQNDVDIPVIGGAAGYVIPEFREALGDLSDGIFSIDTSNYDQYGEFGEAYRERHGQFMTHEAFEHAVALYALDAAVREAGSIEPQAVSQALREVRVEDDPVSGLPGGGIDFDETGLNAMTYPIMVQWQDGELKTVWPASDAKAEPVWQE